MNIFNVGSLFSLAMPFCPDFPYIYIYIYICIYIYLSIYLSIYISIYLSIYPSRLFLQGLGYTLRTQRSKSLCQPSTSNPLSAGGIIEINKKIVTCGLAFDWLLWNRKPKRQMDGRRVGRVSNREAQQIKVWKNTNKNPL